MKNNKIKILFGPPFVFLLLLLFPILFSFDYLEPIRNALSDFEITDIGLQLQQEEQSNNAGNIVVVDINKFNKKKLFYVLKSILKTEPKVIGILEVVPEKGFEKYNDSIISICRQYPRIVFGSELEDYNKGKDDYLAIKRSWGGFLQNANSGFINISYGKDKKYNTIRTFHPKAEVLGIEESSFALRIAEAADNKAAEHLLKRNNRDEIIDYSLDYTSFFSVSALEVIYDDYSEDLFKDKIVLIAVAPFHNPIKYLNDMCFTPYSQLEEGRPFPDMYEIQVQANIIKMILESNYYDQLPYYLTVIIAILLLYLNFIVFYIISEKIPVWYEILSNLLFLIQSILILVLIIFLYSSFRLYADLTIALLALALMLILFEAYRDTVVPVTISIFKFIKDRGVK